MTLEDVLTTLRMHKPELQRKYPLSSIELFGSYARNEQNSDSDVDVMVEFSEPVGIEFVDLLIELEVILGKPVDLINKKSIRPKLKLFIEHDLITV